MFEREDAVRVAVLGSRNWPDMERVGAWVWRLADKYPRAIVFSGGIGNVHRAAAATALRRGLRLGILVPERRPSAVWDVRAKEIEPDRDYAESADEPFATERTWLLGAAFATFAEAAHVRSAALVAQVAQVQCFHYERSPGTAGERAEAERIGRALHVIELAEAEWRATRSSARTA